MSTSKAIGRRQLIKQTALSALGTWSFARLGLGAAAPSPMPRRHLINIVRFGGWDSLWFHNAVPASEIGALSDPVRGIVASDAFLNTSGNILAPFANHFAQTPTGQWTVRYPDENIFLHPDGVTTMGPGLSFMKPSDFQNICIWRGVTSDGGHYLGNRILQAGGLTGSLPSFSTTVAVQAAQNGRLRNLHYVQIAYNSAELYTQGGVYSSIVQPINIPDINGWRNITSPAPNDIGPGKIQDDINATVAALASLAGDVPNATTSTRDVHAAFLNAYTGANAIAQSNYGGSAEFTAIVAAYQSEINDVVRSHVFTTSWFYASGIGDITAAGGYVEALAFRFALAEFLVKKDLSSVVDILVPGGDGDFHNNSDRECIFHLALFAAFRTLTKRLAATETSLGSGSSLLDITTVVMHTEFERHPLLSSADEAHKLTPGADHWPYATSVWLAGCGVNAGRVIGEFKRGATSAHFSSADFQSIGPYRPLPVDAKTGVVSASGILPTIYNLTPTILEMFDASDLSQLNGVAAFTPLIKR